MSASHRMATTAQRTLLSIHQGALGDWVATFPALLKLQERFDGIDAVCQGGPGRLARSLGLIRRCFPLEAAAMASLFGERLDARIGRLLRSYDDILLLSFSDRLANAVGRSSTARIHRITPRPEPGEHIHVYRHVLKGLRQCGLLEEAEADAAPIFRRRGRPQPRKDGGILIHPGSGSALKNWPLEHFLTVYDLLRGQGLKAEFVLGPAEFALVERIGALRSDLAPVCHLTEDLIDLLALLERSAAFVGNDSGVTHLAAFLGLPSVAVFGPSDPRIWHPWGPSVRVVTCAPDCGPCFTNTDSGCTRRHCLTEISPQSVLQALDGITGWQESGHGRAKRALRMVPVTLGKH